jgi:hypothetical protein
LNGRKGSCEYDGDQLGIRSNQSLDIVFLRGVGDLARRLQQVAWYKIYSSFRDHCTVGRYMRVPCIGLSLSFSFSLWSRGGSGRERNRHSTSSRTRTYLHATHILRLHHLGMQRTTLPGLPRGRHPPPPLFAWESRWS